MDCANCHQAHPTQHCPEIRALLMRPSLYRCDECGDATDAAGICPACSEWMVHSIIGGIAHQALDTDYAPLGWA